MCTLLALLKLHCSVGYTLQHWRLLQHESSRVRAAIPLGCSTEDKPTAYSIEISVAKQRSLSCYVNLMKMEPGDGVVLLLGICSFCSSGCCHQQMTCDEVIGWVRYALTFHGVWHQ